jgi:hypothetical protein
MSNDAEVRAREVLAMIYESEERSAAALHCRHADELHFHKRVAVRAMIAFARIAAEARSHDREWEAMREALVRIAEGNLGEASWQANYDKIRQVAREGLSAVPLFDEGSKA